MSPFSAPFFWGTQKQGLLLPKRAAAISLASLGAWGRHANFPKTVPGVLGAWIRYASIENFHVRCALRRSPFATDRKIRLKLGRLSMIVTV